MGKSVNILNCYVEVWASKSMEFYLHAAAETTNSMYVRFQITRLLVLYVFLHESMYSLVEFFNYEMHRIVQFCIDNHVKLVQTLLDNISKEVGSPVKIGGFLRMEVGDGLQR